jgi:hypothetical protein
VIGAFTKQTIPLVISKKSFGKKELGWLSTRAATARGLMAIDSNVRQEGTRCKVAVVFRKN